MATSLSEVALLDDPAFYAGDPHAVFARLRREQPVFWVERTKFWAVCTHSAIHTVLRDAERFSSEGDQQLVAWTQDREHFMRFSDDVELPPPTARNLITSDPPFHTTFRKMALRTGRFGIKAMPGLEVEMAPFLDALAGELAAGVTGEADHLVSAPLASAATAAFMGLPPSFAEPLRTWSETIEPPGSGNVTERKQTGAEAVTEMWTTFTELLDDAEHGGTVNLLREQQHDAPDVDTDTLLALLCDIAVAGIESMRNMVTSGLVALAQHPDQWHAVASGQVTVQAAVEEILRWVSPAPSQGRVATTDVTLEGQQISAGDRLLLMFVSGNRDESIWADPDRFDVGRKQTEPHVAFGWGTHLCIGASLARMCMRRVLDLLIEHGIGFELASEPIRESGFNATAQYSSAPMSFSAR